MSTLWGGKELGLNVVTGPSLDESWLQDLASRISVRTWPEMEEVPAMNNVGNAANWAGTVTIKPNSALADRWYAIRLSAPFWVEPPSTHMAPDGSYVARFRIGSDPRVAAVVFAGGATKHRLYISMSESVTAQQSPATIVQVQNDGSPVACNDVSFAAGHAMDELGFDCPLLTAFPEQITIEVGLLSTTGVPLAPITITKAELTLSSSCGTDCQKGVVP